MNRWAQRKPTRHSWGGMRTAAIVAVTLPLLLMACLLDRGYDPEDW